MLKFLKPGILKHKQIIKWFDEVLAIRLTYIRSVQGFYQDFGQGGQLGYNGILGGQSGIILLEANTHWKNYGIH